MASLPIDSYYITELPKEVKLNDRTFLSSCPAGFECWSFPDNNVIIFHTTAVVNGLPLQFDIPNVDTPEYPGHDDLIINSDIWID